MRAMSIIAGLKARARQLKSEITALYLAARHPRTPWYAKALVAAIVAYAVSPIDLIPDFIPVLGLLDDLVLIPLGLALVVKLTPADVIADARARAASTDAPRSVAGAVVIGAIWLLVAVVAARWAWRHFAA